MPAPPDAREAQQLALLVDSVSDYAIFMLDASGHVSTWNRGAERIKGYSAKEIIGQPYSAFFTPEDLERQHPQEVLSGALRDGHYEEEGWRVRKDGQRFWANIVMTPVRNAEGVHIGYAKVTRDLTERRRSEDALQEAHDQLRRTNTELDRFAMVAAHDLSEPLTTVSGFAYLLMSRHGDELSPRAHEFLSHITASTERMQRLIATLLEYARAGGVARTTEPIDVLDAAAQVVAILRASIEQRSAEIVLDPSLSGVHVAADRSDVELVLQNLVANAIKFGAAESPRVVVRADRVGADWKMSVTDDGAGIAPEDQARIFGAFQRTDDAASRTGTGLGLAISERIVRRRAGEIGVESAPGRGSRFWFTLPAA